MLSNAKSLMGYHLMCRDGELGRIKDLYFDDNYWAVRYLIADTGFWLPGRKVLVSPYAIEQVSSESREMLTAMSKQQIQDSPPIDDDKPVSQQTEEDYYGYFGWPRYLAGPYMWGSEPVPVRDSAQWTATAPLEGQWDPHLRSADELNGYHIEATDGQIGHLHDLLIDDETWAIRYLVIDTKNWFSGKKVLLAPSWIESMSWPESKVFVHATREMIEQAPAYADGMPLTREDEQALHVHYNRVGYWVDPATA